MKQDDKRTAGILSLIGIIPVVWLALKIAPSVGGGLAEILPGLMTVFNEPFRIELCEDSIKTVLVLLLCYGMGIQLTDGKSFVVTGNKVDVNAGNAFWFHNAAKNSDVTYTISNNDIKAPYIGYSGVTTFDVNTKITSSGNKFNSTDTTKCMKKGATVAEATNLTAIR